jgi:hypothetical protein
LRTPPRSSSWHRVGREASASLAQKAQRGAIACSWRDHNMDGECSSHTGHDNDSPTDGGTTAENQPPHQVMPCSQWRATDVSLHSASHCRVEDSAVVKQTSRQVGCYRAPTTPIAMARAHKCDREDLDDGLRLHPSLDKGGVSPSDPLGGSG